nr:MAG TPA: hypothetical protein [Caudoviricetes sp.]
MPVVFYLSKTRGGNLGVIFILKFASGSGVK